MRTRPTLIALLASAATAALLTGCAPAVAATLLARGDTTSAESRSDDLFDDGALTPSPQTTATSEPEASAPTLAPDEVVPTPATATPPTPPAAMATFDEAGAAAAVVYYWEGVLDYTLLSQDVSRLDEMSATSCTLCGGIGDQVVELRELDEYQVPGLSETTVLWVLPMSDSYLVAVDYRVGATETRLETGEIVGTGRPWSSTLYFTLAYDELGWVVTDIASDDLKVG